MLLKTRLNNKIKLKKLIARIIQFLNTDNKKNTAIFVSKIKEEKIFNQESLNYKYKKVKSY